MVAVDEIRVGDNDTLAAHVASLLEADLLVICSDIDGLYTAAPQSNPDARRIEVVQQINDEIWNLAGGAGTAHGTGGMWTKIQAADLATRASEKERNTTVEPRVHTFAGVDSRQVPRR